MKGIIIKFGLLSVALLALVKVSKYTYLTHRLSEEAWFSLFALVFLIFGYFVSKIIFKKAEEKPLVSSVGSPTMAQEASAIDEKQKDKLGISKREYEVLQQISNGLSNQEIAKTLFISESTVKSHVSNLLVKLDAKRRTQAVKKAKELKIIR